MISKSKLFVFVVFSILLFSGCATENPKKTESADAIYKKAMDEYKRRKYSDAIASFYRLKYDYPAEAASVLADLRIADAHFHNKDYNEAITSYEDFRKLHPTSPYVDYVTYQLGLCHYNQILTIDRDQKHTQMALNEFYYLLTHYPSSPYAKPSYEKFLECQKKIVDHEAYVANFYYKKGKYRAAINRFESAVTNYPSIPLKDDMLYIFADSYMKVGEREKAKGVYEFLIKQYPDSKYAKKARDIIVKRIETGPKIPQKPVAEDSEIDKGPPLTPGKEETQEDRQGLQEVKGIGEDALSVGSEAFSEPVSWASSPSINSRGTIQKDENWDKYEGSPKAGEDKDHEGGRGEKRERDNVSKASGQSSFKGLTFSAHKPIHITADRMEAFQRENRVVFTGHVVAKQEDITLFADQIETFLKGEGEGGGLKRVISRGNVKITQMDRVATCEEAIFDDETNTITMIGNPRMWQGKDRIDGERIVTNIDEEKVTVYGSEEKRVMAILYPKEGEGMVKIEPSKAREGDKVRTEGEMRRPSEKQDDQDRMLREEVMQFLSLWKNYWEKKEIDQFIDLYSVDFRYEDMDREAWKEKKRAAFERYRTIRIGIEGVRIERNESYARVDFLQRFEGDEYTDVGRKTLWLKRIDGHWKVIREAWEAI